MKGSEFGHRPQLEVETKPTVHISPERQKAQKEYAEYVFQTEAKYPEIDMQSFVDLYGSENVKKDLAEVAKRKATFEYDSASEYSRLFEVMLADRIEMSDWMGPKTFVTRTSEYDDKVGGIDMVVEFQIEENTFSNLGMAIDVTFSKDKVDKKIKGLKIEIDKGKLGVAKYFTSERQDHRGEFSNIPKVVVGTDPRTIDELMAMIMRVEKLKKFKTDHPHTAGDTQKTIDAVYKQIDNHPYQIELLQQIRVQAAVFAKYARRIGNNYIAARYQFIVSKIDAIAQEKTALIAEDEKLGREKRMLEAIKLALKRSGI